MSRNKNLMRMRKRRSRRRREALRLISTIPPFGTPGYELRDEVATKYLDEVWGHLTPPETK